MCVRVCVMFLPDCPGGGIPDGTLGKHRRTVRTPALLPQQGSTAMGLGMTWGRERREGKHHTTLTNHNPKLLGAFNGKSVGCDDGYVHQLMGRDFSES